MCRCSDGEAVVLSALSLWVGAACAAGLQEPLRVPFCVDVEL